MITDPPLARVVEDDLADPKEQEWFDTILRHHPPRTGIILGHAGDGDGFSSLVMFFARQPTNS